MKKLLIVLIFAICVIGLRSGDYLQMFGVGKDAPSATAVSVKTITVSANKDQQRPMSMEEFAALSKTDPQAYQKFLASRQVAERTETDKLFNFLKHGKYE